MLAPRAVSLLASAATLLACGGTTAHVRIRNPLQVGHLDSNQVSLEHSREERHHDLPAGTLVDRAEIVSLTPQKICLHVTLWSSQFDPDRSNFRFYRIALLNSASGIENTPTEVHLSSPTTTSYEGIAYSTPKTSDLWPRRAVYQLTRQPARLCFRNEGFVTPSTTHLTLRLQNVEGSNLVHFEWDFSSIVSPSPGAGARTRSGRSSR